MSYFVGIVFGPKEEISSKLSIYAKDIPNDEWNTPNPNGKWYCWEIGGIWSGEILHVGSYDTAQAQKEYLSSVDTPYCFIDLDGNWHEKDDPIEWEREFREYLDSISADTWLTVIEFRI